MKIISSFMDDIWITEGELHTITFESSFIQSEFRKLFQQYFQRRKGEETNYLKILNAAGRQIKANDFLFLSFDCNIVNLKNEKSTLKTLKELLMYYLEHNSELIHQYINFNETLELFASNLELGNEELLIEFHPTEKTIINLLNSFEVTLEYRDQEYVPNYLLRNYLIRSLLDMNVQKKNVILLLSFPEIDIGLQDISKTIELLKDLNITTLIISTHRDFLTAADEDKLFLVNEKGDYYDIINLKKELIAFNIIDKDQAGYYSKVLAYQDFKRDYTFLDRFLRTFLTSDRL